MSPWAWGGWWCTVPISLYVVSECSASWRVLLHTERTIAQIKPQGTGPKWSQHCGPPKTIPTAIGDKNRGWISGLRGWNSTLARRPWVRAPGRDSFSLSSLSSSCVVSELVQVTHQLAQHWLRTIVLLSTPCRRPPLAQWAGLSHYWSEQSQSETRPSFPGGELSGVCCQLHVLCVRAHMHACTRLKRLMVSFFSLSSVVCK